MKALVLDGSREGDSLTLVAVQGMTAALAERVDDVKLVKLRELDIAPCAGCFGCWTRTRGGGVGTASHPVVPVRPRRILEVNLTHFNPVWPS